MELVQQVSGQLPHRDLMNLSQASRGMRDVTRRQRDELRAHAARVVQAVSQIVSQNRIGGVQLPREGFRRGFNPHSALANLREALGQPVSRPVPEDANAAIDAADVDTIVAFIDFIPAFASAKQLQRDHQASAIGLARALYSHFGGRFNADQLNRIALAAARMCRGVDTTPHAHALQSEMADAVRRSPVSRHAAGNPWTAAAQTAASFGATLAVAAVDLAVGVPIRGTHQMLKQDKNSNKALKLLFEVVCTIPHREVEDALVEEVAATVAGSGGQGGFDKKRAVVVRFSDLLTPTQLTAFSRALDTEDGQAFRARLWQDVEPIADPWAAPRDFANSAAILASAGDGDSERAAELFQSLRQRIEQAVEPQRTGDLRLLTDALSQSTTRFGRSMHVQALSLQVAHAAPDDALLGRIAALAEDPLADRAQVSALYETLLADQRLGGVQRRLIRQALDQSAGADRISDVAGRATWSVDS